MQVHRAILWKASQQLPNAGGATGNLVAHRVGHAGMGAWGEAFLEKHGKSRRLLGRAQGPHRRIAARRFETNGAVSGLAE